MMISPETYYEMNLKGKTAEQIMSAIRGLKNDLAAQGQELARVEASTESAHKRIDELEKLFHKAHPPV